MSSEGRVELFDKKVLRSILKFAVFRHSFFYLHFPFLLYLYVVENQHPVELRGFCQWRTVHGGKVEFICELKCSCQHSRTTYMLVWVSIFFSLTALSAFPVCLRGKQKKNPLSAVIILHLSKISEG